MTILQEAAERLGDDVGIEMRSMQAKERLRPVDGFGNPGIFERRRRRTASMKRPISRASCSLTPGALS